MWVNSSTLREEVSWRKRGEFKIAEYDSVRTGKLAAVNREVKQLSSRKVEPSKAVGSRLTDRTTPPKASIKDETQERNSPLKKTIGLSPG